MVWVPTPAIEGSNKLSVTPFPEYEPPTGYPPDIMIGELLQVESKGL